jgi:ubiquinone/menaquinone biosynthesis C-methylase UbiE
MERNPMAFDGSISKSYDYYLGPFLFEPYATDLVSRVQFTGASNILELACGTGIVTQRLVNHLSADDELTATDINIDMLTVAQEKISTPNVCWDTVDMTAIPYEQELFDTVVCQFGLMFAADKDKAVAGMRRVLKKNGKLLFNVWASVEENPILNIFDSLTSRFFPNMPLRSETGPFSMANESKVFDLLQRAGFSNIRVESVAVTGICESAADAALGFTIGSPLYNSIKKDPIVVERFRGALEEAISAELGSNPVQSPLRALVFSAEK